MSGPLAGIRILDFTWALAGPYGTMILCDLGAEVIKVELPDLTEEERGFGPYLDGFSTYFLSVNRGKKSLTLDLRTEEARQIVYELVRHVDVVTENFSPGTMAKLGLDYERFREFNPRLIYAACSGFGQTGPYSQRGAVDIIVQAMGGIMSLTGSPDGPPMRVGVSIGDMAAGLYLAIGVLAALVERDRSGRGQFVDIAMLDAQVSLLENAVIRYAATGEVATRLGTRHPLVTPFQAFETADGWIVVAGAKNWDLFCIKLGVPELALDERFTTNERRTAHRTALEPILQEIFRQRTTDEWLQELESAALVAPINDIAQVVADPQVQARDMIVELPLPGNRDGQVKVVGSPLKLSRTPAVVKRTAPTLGEHTRQVLAALLGLSEAELAALAEKGVIAPDNVTGAGGSASEREGPDT